MSSSFSNLGIELIGNNEQAGTWGTTTNTNFQYVLDQAIAGYGYVAMTSGSPTSVTMPNGASGTGRPAYLELTGTGGASTYLNVPSSKTKIYYIYNGASGYVTVRAGSGDPGIVVPAGARYVLVCDGTNVKNATNGNNVGTGNLVARFTDQNTLSTGVIYDDGTNVGIGAISTAARAAFGGASNLFAMSTPNIIETATVVGSPATGTINYDLTTQSVVYYTSNATGNWTINFRASSGYSLDSILPTGRAITAVFLAVQGSTAFYNSLVQIDGSTPTVKWQGGTPSAGNASSIDVYTYSIIKTGSATYTVLASQTPFS
jgi:hypothetical protein